MKRNSLAVFLAALAVLIFFPALPALGASTSKTCVAAQKKVTKEQSHLDGVQQSIDSKQRALPNCTVSTLCNRFKLDLKALAKLKARHEKRLAKFTAGQDKACKPIATTPQSRQLALATGVVEY